MTGEKKKSFKLDCFLTVPCTVERRLQRRTHGLTRKINDRRQSQLNACFNQGSPEETRLPLSHNLNVPMEMYSCLLTAKKFQPQASVTLSCYLFQCPIPLLQTVVVPKSSMALQLWYNGLIYWSQKRVHSVKLGSNGQNTQTWKSLGP